jgi:hypothetical protein
VFSVFPSYLNPRHVDDGNRHRGALGLEAAQTPKWLVLNMVLALSLGTIFSASACLAQGEIAQTTSAPEPQQVTFNAHIRPIMSNTCPLAALYLVMCIRRGF